MNTALALLAAVAGLVGIAAAVPVYGDYFLGPQESLYRFKKSYYPAPSPCAAASHLQLGGYGAGAVLHPASLHAGYSGPAGGYGYGAPHYRASEAEQAEGSEVQEHASARSYDGYGAGLASSGGYGAGLAVSGGYGGLGGHGDLGGLGGHGGQGGPSVGVFPNANVRNCAVPLLFSCSPSVVTGHVVRQQYSAPAYGAPAYGHGLYRASEEPAPEMSAAQLTQ